MKRILLTSTALVAFAGAAAAEVSWNGDAEIGYNDDVENGFYWSMGLTLNAEQELNNGLVAGFTLDIDLDDDSDFGENTSTFGQDAVTTSDYVLYLKSDTAALYFGDTDTAADKLWNGTKNMGQDGFWDNEDFEDNGAEGILRGDLMMGGLEASISYGVGDSNGGTEDDDLKGMQLGLSYTTGAYNFGLAYQDDDHPAEIFGVWAGATFGGADVKVAYAKNNTDDEDSIGIQVDYPFGPVTATVFYSAESAYDDNYGLELAYANGPVTVDFWYHDGTDEELGLEGSYDMGNGLKMYAGYIKNDGDSDASEAYIAGTYDLGGGAELLVSYGDAGDTYTGDLDEIGDNFEVNDGTTVAVSFEF